MNLPALSPSNDTDGLDYDNVLHNNALVHLVQDDDIKFNHVVDSTVFYSFFCHI